MYKQPTTAGRLPLHQTPPVQLSDLATYKQLVPLYIMGALNLLLSVILVIMVGVVMSTGSKAVTSLGGAFGQVNSGFGQIKSVFSEVNASQVQFAQTLFSALSRMGEGQRQAIGLLLSQHQALDQGQSRIIKLLSDQQQQQNTPSN